MNDRLYLMGYIWSTCVSLSLHIYKYRCNYIRSCMCMSIQKGNLYVSTYICQFPTEFPQGGSHRFLIMGYMKYASYSYIYIHTFTYSRLQLIGHIHIYIYIYIHTCVYIIYTRGYICWAVSPRLRIHISASTQSCIW